MHIILGLISLLGIIGLVVHRINMASEGARHLADLAGEAANLPRKMRFKSKAGKKGLAIVDDPREAATILMLGVARCAGEVSVEQKTAIRSEIMQNFQFNEEEAEELLAHASWVSSDLPDAESAINRMMDLIAQTMNQEDMGTLLNMLKAIASAEGEPRPVQKVYISNCRARVGLR